eukprot:g71241.t1
MLLFLGVLGYASAQSISIAGYVSLSNVTQHNRIDLDIQNIADNVGLGTAQGYTNAKTTYTDGRFSFRSDGTKRSIKSFSVRNPVSEFANEGVFQKFNTYWTTVKSIGAAPFQYADRLSTAALDGTSIPYTNRTGAAATLNFGAVNDAFRMEAAEKAPLFFNVWYYVLWEMEQAVMDCENRTWTGRVGNAMNWDEAVAFWTGSLEDDVRPGTGEGVLWFSKANYQCPRFATCVADGNDNWSQGYAAANSKLFDWFEAGKGVVSKRISAGYSAAVCKELDTIKNKTVGQMLVPLVQGTIYYMQAVSKIGVGQPNWDQYHGELWAYASSFLPLLHSCDPWLAEDLFQTVWDRNSVISASKLSDLKQALKAQYGCMGFTCEDIGPPGTCSTSLDIAGYSTLSDVTQHTRIDLDLKTIDESVALGTGPGYTTAGTTYRNGRFSFHQNGQQRSIKQFSVRSLAGRPNDQFATEPWFQKFNSYWFTLKGIGPQNQYANALSEAALNGTSITTSAPNPITLNFLTAGAAFRMEAAEKAPMFFNVWYYVVWEMEDAVRNCKDPTWDFKVAGGEVSWDEAPAFWTGSLEGSGLEGNDAGYGLFGKATKMCRRFATCYDADADGDGYAMVNKKLFGWFAQGKALMMERNANGYSEDVCKELEVVKNESVKQMVVPMVQGTIYYMEQVSASSATAPDWNKFHGELWAYASSILPLVHSCDPWLAEQLFQTAWNPNVVISPSRLSDLKQALKAQYGCMGFTCADVGPPGTCSTSMDIAGYSTLSDVMQYTRIDLDLKTIDENVGLGTPAGYTAAGNTYRNGKFSFHQNGQLRSIKQFSVRSLAGRPNDQFATEPWFKMFNAYWFTLKGIGPQYQYANALSEAALNGTTLTTTGSTPVALNFATVGPAFRIEAAEKGPMFFNVWYYVVWEMENAVRSCRDRTYDFKVDGGDVSWDEAPALWTGSLEGSGLEGNDAGYGLFGKATKQCRRFATCYDADADGDGYAMVNKKLFGWFAQGKALMMERNANGYSEDVCKELEVVKNESVKQMVVPMVQGTIYYMEQVSASSATAPDWNKFHGELWAYASSILPLVHSCDPWLAEQLFQTAWNPNVVISPSRLSDLKQALKAQYGCMGFTCADVGPPGTCSTSMDIAGYSTLSDVMQHTRIDLDLKTIDESVGLGTPAGYTAAGNTYRNGKFSFHQNGTQRSIKQFSVRSLAGKPNDQFATEPWFKMFNAYWFTLKGIGPQYQYANALSEAALNGTSITTNITNSSTQVTLNFGTVGTAFRAEAAEKAPMFFNVWYYVVWEMEDAVRDCRDRTWDFKVDGGEVSWDEAPAFWTGSLEGSGLEGNDAGYGLFGKATKQCRRFATCYDADADGDGYAMVNKKLFGCFAQGKALMMERNANGYSEDVCKELEVVKNESVKQMMVPMVQGTIYYMEQVSASASTQPDWNKFHGELWAYASSILPLVHSCDPWLAEQLFQTAWNPNSTISASKLSDLKQALKAQYGCMGFTCADVGPPGTCSTSLDIAGYSTMSDVMQHARIDLDLKTIDESVALGTPAGYAAAGNTYRNGKFSFHQNGQQRSIKQFSVRSLAGRTNDQFATEPWFKMFNAYWFTLKGIGPQYQYANALSEAALNGTSIRSTGSTPVTLNFATVGPAFRMEAAEKAPLFFNVWYYVVWEMEDAVRDCRDRTWDFKVEGGEVSWDEAPAFWTGSLEGSGLEGNDAGYGLFGKATKQCRRFATCYDADADGDGYAMVNKKLFGWFAQGKALMMERNANGYSEDVCKELEIVKNESVKQMMVPMVQGTIYYMEQVSATPIGQANWDKFHGELWAYGSSILPLVHSCDPWLAEQLFQTFWNPNSVIPATKLSDLKQALKAQYGCMGFTCADVGPPGTCSTSMDIAGYSTLSDVMQHARIDLDLKTIDESVALGTPAGYTAAITTYQNGKFSFHQNGQQRTIKRFSVRSLAGKPNDQFATEPWFQKFNAYWFTLKGIGQEFQYANALSEAALSGSTLTSPGSTDSNPVTLSFATVGPAFRMEAAEKAPMFFNVWYYVVWEMEDAVRDCRDPTWDFKVEGGEVSWDEAPAFWTGSLEGSGLEGNDAGYGLFGKATKQCRRFATCYDADADGDGYAMVNKKLFGWFAQGKALMMERNANGYSEEVCKELEMVKNEAVKQMVVPMVQGTIYYMEQVSASALGQPDWDKFHGELWAYGSSILPLVHSCDPWLAEQLFQTAWNPNSTISASKLSDFKQALKAQYGCMGFTCADVGPPGTCSTSMDIAGYSTLSDVMQYTRIDLDLKYIEENVALGTSAAYAAAKNTYQNGKFSFRQNGQQRSIKQFSVRSTENQFATEPWFKMFNAYWFSLKGIGQQYQYANAMSEAALSGTTLTATGSNPVTLNFGTVGPAFRAEAAEKAPMFFNVWYYVVWEMENAVRDCRDRTWDFKVDGGDVSWDEAPALWTGSLEGSGLEGNDAGYGLFGKATKQCRRFATCYDADADGDGYAMVNKKLFGWFAQGKALMMERIANGYSEDVCKELEVVKNESVKQMMVPMVQGTIYYLEQVSQSAAGEDDWDKFHGELWAYSSSILPLLHSCDPWLAEQLFQLTWNPSGTILPSRLNDLKLALKAQYGCMGFTCADVGPPGACSTHLDVAGYSTLSDMTQHTRIDLDLKSIEESLALGTPEGYAAAKNTYQNGKFSFYQNGQQRSIKKFSVRSLAGKPNDQFATEPWFQKFNTYWFTVKGIGQQYQYANALSEAALSGTTLTTTDSRPVTLNFGTVGAAFRAEAAEKAPLFFNVWYYVVWEMQDAVLDCQNPIYDFKVEGGDVSWDEAPAFWTGSLEGYTRGGTGTGYSLFSKANKNGARFGTSLADGDQNQFSGYAVSNMKLFDWFEAGKALMMQRNANGYDPVLCLDMIHVMKKAVSQMLVPMVQGTIYYLKQVSMLHGLSANPNWDKYHGELWAYASSILPVVHSCDPVVAEMLFKTAWDPSSVIDEDNYQELRQGLQAQYSCMGITCEDIGDSEVNCTNPIMEQIIAAVFPVAGYVAVTDVTQQTYLDQDVQEITSETEKKTQDGFRKAKAIYANGKYSRENSGSGSMRTIKSFSVREDAEKPKDEFATEKWFKIFNSYWVNQKSLAPYTYANQLSSAALDGTRVADIDFRQGVKNLNFRAEAAEKAPLLFNIWYYVVWSMHSAVLDCNSAGWDGFGNQPSNWDEAVAFYTGSQEGAFRGGKTMDVSLFSKAQKFCARYSTCVADGDGIVDSGYAASNARIFDLFESGKDYLRQRVSPDFQNTATQRSMLCGKLEGVKDKVVSEMVVPLIQGMLWYLEKVQETEQTSETELLQKYKGEFWAYTSAVLPLIDNCDAQLAERLYQRAWEPNGYVYDPAVHRYGTLKRAVERIYSCLGITCEQVGGGGEACKSAFALAGYFSLTDVYQHSRIDLDLNLMTIKVNSPRFDYVGALDLYENGYHSMMDDDSVRTIKGFSVRADAGQEPDQMANEKWFKVFDNYWQSKGLPQYTYADALSSAALRGTVVNGTNFNFFDKDKAGAFRVEAAEKGPLFFNIMYYVIWEMELAVKDCATPNWRPDIDEANNWDEAVAFYTGSLEGAYRTGTGADASLYSKAQKNCVRFQTCTADGDGSPLSGYAAANAKMFDIFETGKILMSQRISFRLDTQAQAGICEQLDVTKDMAVRQLWVPFIQGTIYYADRVSDEPTSQKYRGEFWAYASAILPIVGSCDTAVAQALYKAAWDTTSSVNYDAVKAALESVYTCMGVTCADIGAQLGQKVCSSDVGVVIAGYVALTDVTQQSRIDLDLARIEDAISDGNDYAQASAVYAKGGGSMNADGSYRTIKSFSVRTDAGQPIDQMAGENVFDIFDSYWRSKGLDKFTYADQLSNASLSGGKVGGLDFAAASQAGDFRAEAAEKSPLFFNVWYYVVWQMHQAVLDCRDKTWVLGSDTLNWDEAVAFWTGSLEGRNRPRQDWKGKSLFSKAQKMCQRLETCTADGDNEPDVGYAAANAKLFEIFEAGKARLAERVSGFLSEKETTRVCNDLEALKGMAVAQMTVPMLQGTLYYLSQVQHEPDSQKYRGELWAYASSILPLINKCDFNLANKLYTQAWENSNMYTFADLKTELEQIYPCLGITCADVGGADPCLTFNGKSISSNDPSLAAISGMTPSSPCDDKQPAILGLLIAILVIMFVFIAYLLCKPGGHGSMMSSNGRNGDVEDPNSGRRSAGISMGMFVPKTGLKRPLKNRQSDEEPAASEDAAIPDDFRTAV